MDLPFATRPPCIAWVGQAGGHLSAGHPVTIAWVPFILKALSDQQGPEAKEQGSALRTGREGRAAASSGAWRLSSCPHPLVPSPYLFHYHPKFALGAEHGLDPRQPLDAGENLGWADEHLARVEAVGIIEEETLQDLGPDRSPVSVPPQGTALSMPRPPSKASTLPKANPQAPEQHLSNPRCMQTTWRS